LLCDTIKFKFFKEKMMKSLPIILVLGVATYAYAAGEFGEVDGIVTEFGASGEKILGVGIRWIIGLMPLVLFVVGIFGGMKYAKKQADQDHDNTKVYVSAVIGGVAGSMVGMLLIALIGTALLGNATLGLGVLTDFWKGLLGVS
jgi:hypothetical protein